MLSGRQAAKAQLIIHIKAETVGLALFHSLGSIAHIITLTDFTRSFWEGQIFPYPTLVFNDTFYSDGGLHCYRDWGVATQGMIDRKGDDQFLSWQRIR